MPKFMSAEYVKSLSNDPLEALDTIFTYYFGLPGIQRVEYNRALIGILKSYHKNYPEVIENLIDINSLIPYIGSAEEESETLSRFDRLLEQLKSALSRRYQERSLRKAREEVTTRTNIYDELLESGEVDPILTDDDISNIQHLINELRDSIVMSDLQGEHKKRLLSKLGALQSELDKDIPYRQVLMGELIDIIVFIKVVDKETVEIQEKCSKIFKHLIKPVGRVLGLPVPDLSALTSGKQGGDAEDTE